MSGHRTIKEGRASCLLCRKLHQGDNGLKQHWQEKHPEEWYRLHLGSPKDKRDLKGRGYLVCYHHGPKFVYQSQDAAYLIAMLIFITRGFLLEPYLCAEFQQWTTTAQVIRGDGYKGKKFRVWRRNSNRKILLGCGRWHLTNKVYRLPA